MKNQEIMNANRLLYIVFFYSVFTFSQNKEDVYFIMNNKKSNKYLIIGELDVLTNYITVYNKKEYDYHQKKVKEAKEKGTFEWDAEGGRDNLNIHVTKLTFVILSKKK